MPQARPPDPPEIAAIVHPPESTDRSHRVTRLILSHAAGHGAQALNQGWAHRKQDVLQRLSLQLLGEKIQHAMTQALHGAHAPEWGERAVVRSSQSAAVTGLPDACVAPLSRMSKDMDGMPISDQKAESLFEKRVDPIDPVGPLACGRVWISLSTEP